MTFNSIAQDKRNTLCYSFELSHHIAEGGGDNGKFLPINPGGGIIYRHHVSNNIAFLTGANYSFSRWKYNFSTTSQFKRKAHEFSVPLLAEKKIRDKLFITIGSYVGWLISGKEENLNKNVSNWIDITENSGYSESSKFSCDLYFDFGYRYEVAEKPVVLIAPFVKYKLEDNWMDEVRGNICFGLSIRRPINVSKK